MAQALTAIQKEEIKALRNNNKSIREVAKANGFIILNQFIEVVIY